MFSAHLENFLPFSSILKLSSANSFSLEAFKICRLAPISYSLPEEKKLYFFKSETVAESKCGYYIYGICHELTVEIKFYQTSLGNVIKRAFGKLYNIL